MSNGRKHGLVIHGGAGTILKSKMSPELEKEYRDKLKEILSVGHAMLKEKRTALVVAEECVKMMEDSPLFNAGRGSVFTADEKHEMDATIMDGKELECGGVASVNGVRNPITLASRVMTESPHVLLGGESAREFAKEQKLEIMPDDYFYTERRYEQLVAARNRDKNSTGDQSTVRLSEDDKHGTVGAVALDIDGNLAAATSSGGMTNKRPGRIGDSSIIGAGTYANNAACAVSCTGHGEYFMRAVTAFDVHARMKHKSLSMKNAAGEAIDELSSIGGTGGLIAIDKDGNISMPFNCEGMYRGYISDDGQPNVAIYKDEEVG